VGTAALAAIVAKEKHIVVLLATFGVWSAMRLAGVA
jgi:hypothetical protein